MSAVDPSFLFRKNDNLPPALRIRDDTLFPDVEESAFESVLQETDASSSLMMDTGGAAGETGDVRSIMLIDLVIRCDDSRDVEKKKAMIIVNYVM